MKKTPASLRSDAPAAISETGGRNGTKSLAELSEIPTQAQRGFSRYPSCTYTLRFEHRGKTPCMVQICRKHERLSVRCQLEVVFYYQAVSLFGVDDPGKLFRDEVPSLNSDVFHGDLSSHFQTF